MKISSEYPTQRPLLTQCLWRTFSIIEFVYTVFKVWSQPNGAPLIDSVRDNAEGDIRRKRGHPSNTYLCHLCNKLTYLWSCWRLHLKILNLTCWRVKLKRIVISWMQHNDYLVVIPAIHGDFDLSTKRRGAMLHMIPNTARRVSLAKK